MIANAPVRRHRGIDQGVRGLVRLLNEVPYIETASSCHGHFGFDRKLGIVRDEPAEVLFYVRKGLEAEFETLVQVVLKHTMDMQVDEDVWVEVGMRWYGVPGQFPVPYRQHYVRVSVVSPFMPGSEQAPYSDIQKRRLTNMAIGRLEEAVTEYLDVMDRNTV
ncbi:hypothetical protein HYV82_04410 [Candidatus Woesearchaeota archaeon]|nr:hypothetical protein [Candidatus Woesearchaeota archaeon]